MSTTQDERDRYRAALTEFCDPGRDYNEVYIRVHSCGLARHDVERPVGFFLRLLEDADELAFIKSRIFDEYGNCVSPQICDLLRRDDE